LSTVTEPISTTVTDPTGRNRLRHGLQRADIQGLRALAVGLVLIYHLRPARLPGGFVGVDVFFVISGFLIIGSLVEEIRRTGRLRMAAFYARRLRRLLPAASVVLLVTVVATLILVPMPGWPAIMQQIAASALDVQNWLLAIFSSDYAHATAAASPVQHFWSLSVEEQFYLVIPLILLVTAIAARRSRHPLRWLFAAVALVGAASLAYSILTTTAPPQAAYYVTPTRMWELCLGGLTAIALRRVRVPHAPRLVLGWLGLALVVFSAVAFTTAMAFPGWIALVPVLGAVAMIVAGSRAKDERLWLFDVAAPLRTPPLRYLGDISYSLYLWHWPVIVFVLERTGGDALTTPQVYKAAALSLVLAIGSKHLIEDPFRQRKTAGASPTTGRAPFRRRLRASYLLGVGFVVLTLVSSTVPWTLARKHVDELLLAATTLDANHPGALAFDPTSPRPAPSGVPLLPDPAVAGNDLAAAWSNNCANYDPAASPVTSGVCEFGNPRAPKTMVLLGDSHMTMFSTALINFATESGEWRVKLLVHDGCAFGDLPPSRSGYPLKVCADIAYQMLPALLKMKPDLVVTAGYTLGSTIRDGARTWDQRAVDVAGYLKLLQPLAGAGIHVDAIRDVPLMTQNTPECLQRNADNRSRCDTSRPASLGNEVDPLDEAVSSLAGGKVADLTRWLCTATTCPAVIGNVVVYRDNHLTDTFVRSLTQPLISSLGLA
jgi:peptidoglycan/LPS O-acetylase OafA/YrhL